MISRRPKREPEPVLSGAGVCLLARSAAPRRMIPSTGKFSEGRRGPVLSPELTAADVAATPSAVRAVWNSPLYRGATAALFLSGLGTSAAAPQITLFLVNDLHVSLTTAGLYYLTSLTAPVAGFLIGARSDRTGSRLGYFRLCAGGGFPGWWGTALAHQLWVAFLISAVVLAFAGAASSQLFAAVHDDLEATASPVGDGVISIVRMALTAGWIVGPVAGS